MKNFKFLKLVMLFTLVFIGIISQAQVEILIKPGPDDGKDAYISSNYSNRNGSTQSFIASAWTYGGDEGFGRSFIHFPLPELPANYSNFRVLLNFYYDYSSQHVGHGGDNACKLERITEDWTENGIDWFNQPSVSEENSVFIPASETSNQDYPDIDVTQLVLDMYENPAQSFGFRMSLIEETIYRSMIFASGDHPDESIRPSLVISYDTCSRPVGSFTYQIDSLNCQFYYNDTSVTNWHWDFGNGYGSNLQNPSYNYNEAGTYFVCLEVENDCGTNTICDSVIVCDNSVPSFTYEIENLNVNFTNHSINSLTYYWDFGNGFFSYLENPEFQYDTPGDYLVCLSAINLCGTITYCDTITIDILEDVNSLIWKSTIGLFPNPAQDEVFIKSDDLLITRFEMFNSQGILTDMIIPGSYQNNYRISLQGKAPGLYLIKLFTDKGSITRRLIVL